jgi:SAM-dependent methyltransferase
MGIVKDHINLICAFKKNYPKLFLNSTLTISEQAVYANDIEVKNIFSKNKLSYNKINIDFDKKNKVPLWLNTSYEKNVNAKYLFTLLGSSKVISSDISKYEKADLQIDLNKKVKKKLFNSFENIIDFGTLEHIFDINTALENYIRMLKKGGYLLIAVPCSNMIDHGFYSISPTLFYDYFSVNNFQILDSYLRISSPYIYEYKSIFYKYSQTGLEIPITSDRAVEFIVLAKKIRNTHKVKKPIQSVYYKKKNWRMNIYSSKVNKKNNYPSKKIIFLILTYLPFFFQKLLYLFLRGKNIKKVKIQ